MERRWRSRAATRPAPQGGSNPTRCAKKKQTLHRGCLLLFEVSVGFEPEGAWQGAGGRLATQGGLRRSGGRIPPAAPRLYPSYDTIAWVLIYFQRVPLLLSARL